MKGREDEEERALTKVFLTSLSAMVAETTTFPIDITKTRLQLHGESLSSSRSASALGVAGEILRREGLVGLYKGLSPAIVRHMFYTPIRIVFYEHLRNTLVASTDPSLSLSTKALIGGFSGVIAQIVASPADLVKVRMQADGRMVSQGFQPRLPIRRSVLAKTPLPFVNLHMFRHCLSHLISQVVKMLVCL